MNDLSFLAGAGEMAARIREHDWSSTPLGEPAAWPQSLKTSVRLLLTTHYPIAIFWGPELIQIYNDAYRELIGAQRHPSALGQTGRECWQDAWHLIGPQFEQVMSGRGATWDEDRLVPITRNGVTEQAYWTYSYSPIDEPSADSRVGGVLAICTETTRVITAERHAQAERSRLQNLFAQAPGFMCTLRGPNHRFEMVNAAYLRLVDRRTLIGETVLEAFPELESQGFIDLLDGVYRTGTPFIITDARLLLESESPKARRELYVDFVYQPMTDDAGAVVGIFVQGHDVTRMHHTLADTESRYHSLFNSIDAGFCVIEVDFDDQRQCVDYLFLETNRAFERQSGIVGAVGRRMREIAPGHEQFWFDIYGEVARTGGPAAFVYEAVALGRWFDFSAYRIGNADAHRVAVIFNDVTARKHAEAQRELMLGELNHRVKNTLSTVQSIARMTWSHAITPESFQDDFQSRLQALSITHNLLSRDAWTGVALADILRSELAPFLRGDVAQVEVDCAEIQLDPKSALALSMVLHELTTNAVKHGALSVPEGRLDIRCTSRQEGKARTLSLEWRERDGPTVNEPTRRGFGSRVISEGLAYELDARVSLDFDPAGVICRIDVPISEGSPWT